MNWPPVPWWRKLPLVKMLAGLVAGIILQKECSLPVILIGVATAIGFLLLVAYGLLPLAWRFRASATDGVLISWLTLCTGALLVWASDVRNDPGWAGRQCQPGDLVLAALQEPLVEKANSFKAVAAVHTIYREGRPLRCRGRLLVYLKKEQGLKGLGYGSVVAFRKPWELVRNSGNPAAFDYRAYLLAQGITHQVYLQTAEFVVLPRRQENLVSRFVFGARQWVVKTIRQFVPKAQQGLAEALLIGYKDDLDKTLVQAYSNTGVVHVIAISGLHLGLIYGLLVFLTKPLRGRTLALPRLILILSALWLFSLMAGAQPSVLRSAVMFSFLAWGEVISRRGSIFNSLAVSAFVLLCCNPFWLWDAGFQLSYMAVISIILFFRPVYNWLYFPHPLPDAVWKLNAVTISAQLLTTPVSMFQFHQLPLLFLFTNLVAVPLSSLILMAELLLCSVFPVQVAAKAVGKLCGILINWMNLYIERFDRVPFATWGGLSIDAFQAILLTIFILSFAFWLMGRQKLLLWCALICLLGFVAKRSASFIEAGRQKKIIVYNVPRHTAIDLICGRQIYFTGDSSFRRDPGLTAFHLQASRTFHRLQKIINAPPDRAFFFCGKRILHLDTSWHFKLVHPRPDADILILSGKPRLYIPELAAAFRIGMVVIDGSVPAWKARLWKKDCDSLKLPCHDVSEKGAFVISF